MNKKIKNKQWNYTDYRRQINKLFVKPLAKQVAHDESTSKIQEKQLTKELSDQMNQGLDESLAMIHEGILLLEIDGKLPASFKETNIQNIIKNQRGDDEKSLQEVLGITTDEFITIYTLANEYYQRTAYREAQALFLLLIEINPSIAASWQGLGLCYEQIGNYKEAAALYLIAAELHSSNFAPYLWAADCLDKLGQYDERKKILDHAIERSEGHKEFDMFTKEASSMLARR